MSSRIEQIIEEIEEYIDSCKFQPLSTSKIIVNKDQMDELLRELRMKTPDEIKRYQKIIANKDAILADAQAKADSMLEEAQIHTNELVSEHEIMQQAYAQANEIVTAATEQAQEILDNATSDANEIRIGAMRYADNLMANAEGIIGHTLDSYTTKYDSLVNSLQECYDMVRNNRAELDIPDQPAAVQNEDQGYEQEEEPAETISQPAPVSQPEEEEQEQSIEDYLNSLIEFDEKSSETIGLAVSNMRIRAEEQGDTVCPVLYCEVSYSKETYVLVRCPMIKVIFYDAKGCIDNVAMHPVSRIHTGQDIVEMAFKKSTVKNWKNKSKIKVLVTL